METAFETLVRLFEDDELTHEVDYNRKVVSAGFKGRQANYRLYFYVDEEEGLLQIFAATSVIVPDGARPSVAEAVTRANYALKVGKFEMDYADGELRFQIYHCFSESTIDQQIVRRLLGTALHTFDRYFPAFMSIIYGNEVPKDAIEHVEKLSL